MKVTQKLCVMKNFNIKVITVVLKLITYYPLLIALFQSNWNFWMIENCIKEAKNEFFHRDKNVLEFHANFKKVKTASIGQLSFFSIICVEILNFPHVFDYIANFSIFKIQFEVWISHTFLFTLPILKPLKNPTFSRVKIWQ